MEVSRLSFRKETKEQMSKPMSGRAKGAKLFARLEELDKDGTLSKAKSRADVAALVGYPPERAKAGYSWVSNNIARGYITETILAWAPSGKAEAEYHTTAKKPNYNYEERVKRRVKKELHRWQDKVAAGQIPQPISEGVAGDVAVLAVTKMEITKDGTTIKLELPDVNKAIELVRQLLNN